MTVPAHVLAAVRSIPHPRQEPDMSAPFPSPAEPAEESAVEKVARALWEADNCLNPDADSDFLWALTDNHGLADRYRRLAAAAIAAVPIGRPASIRAMLDVADNLDYYASKTAGGTHASGLEDAAAQIRAAIDTTEETR